MIAMTPDGPTAAERFTALLVADDGDPSGAEAELAIAAAGGRPLRRLTWADASGPLEEQAGHPVLMLEAGGVDAETLERVLPRLDAYAAGARLPVVAVCNREAIDLFAATLVSARTELLCEPETSDRLAALAVVTLPLPERMFERVHEDDGRRLRRLNDEVARIADVLARLAARDEPRDPSLETVAERRQSFGLMPMGGGAGEDDDAPAVAAGEVRRAIRARRLREQFFGKHLLEDPGWDMLLDLFAAELERGRVSVSSLCIAAAVAPTTALRWIGKMTDAGLLDREADPFDRRRAYMVLTPRASEGMRGYFAAVRRAGLAAG